MNHTPSHSAIHRTRRHTLAAAAMLALGALCAPVALAQAPTYPAKAITFVVPFAAGSATDQLARALGGRLILANRAGGGLRATLDFPGQ